MQQAIVHCTSKYTLHTFPTRRSSDLTAVEAPRRHVGVRVQTARHPARGVGELSGLAGVVASRRPRRDLPRGARSEEPRLNSSHLVISYAVFCLKKKKSNLSSISKART